MSQPRNKRILPAALSGAAMLILAVSSAAAQDYGPGGEPADSAANNEIETVIVIAPTDHPDSLLGAHGPIHKVYMSRRVSYADLDLRTSDGVDELHRRIKVTARGICRDLARQYPTIATFSPSCAYQVFDSTNAQVTAAIRHAWEVAER